MAEEMELDESSIASSDEEDEGTTAGRGENSMAGYILVSIIRKGIMTMEELDGVISRACKYFKIGRNSEWAGSDGIKGLIERVNSDIRKFKLVIKVTRCEFSGKEYYMLMTQSEIPVVRFQTSFKKQEVAIIESCLNKMLKSETFSLPFPQCVDLVKKSLPKSTYTTGRNFIKKIVRAKYLAINGSLGSDAESGDDDELEVTIGCRAIMELCSAISDKHPNVLTTCKLCYKTLLHGYDCRECGVSVHIHCLQGYVQMSTTCPSENCSSSWLSTSSLLCRRRPASNVTQQPVTEESNESD